MKKLPLLLLLVAFNLNAQQNPDLQKLRPKRFIDKVEVFAGPSLCFNHGNMFINNYRGNYANGNYVQNKRLMKIAYSIGVGVYHPISDWLDIGLRVLWEQKGYNSELDRPLVNTVYRVLETTDYTYSYLTFNLISKIYLDKRKKNSIIMGGYYSNIKTVNGSTIYQINGQVNSKDLYRGRQVQAFDDDGAVRRFGFSPGLESFQKYDYGIVVGFGYSLHVKDQHNISIQLIDNFGLQNINKQVFGSTLTNPPEKNHTLSFIIGYVFNR